MKKHQSYFVFLVALLLASTMQAEVKNYVGGYVNAGEWSMLPFESTYTPSVGGAGGLGFLYELQVGKDYSVTHFLFDAGLGAQYGVTRFLQTGADQEIVLPNQKDLDGDPFTYVYSMRNRHDSYSDLALNAPIMIGVQHKKFYMLAGVKIYYHLLTQTKSSLILSTLGRYDAFDDFGGDKKDMPEYQFFDNLSYSNGVKTKFNLDVDVSLEIGGRFGIVASGSGYDVPKRKTEMRLAAFVDYGLFDLHTAGSALALGTKNAAGEIVPIEGNLQYNAGSTYPAYGTRSMVDNIVLNDVMSTSNFAKSVNNLMAGIKFTILFQVPEKGPCVICREARRHSFRHSRRGVKYEE